MTATSQKTHFGFRDVSPEEKTSLVGEVFSRVAGRYDVMNDLMSAGLHRLWKRDLVSELNPRAGARILDIAGGTGDVAFRILEKEKVNVTVCDINPDMLEQGQARAIDKNILEGIEWTCASAEQPPSPTSHYNACTMAFGIRNVTDIPKALKEIYRVLAPGGRFLCLEFSQFAIEALQPLYDAYSFKVIPKIGEIVAKDKDAYQYLVESIRKFPNQETFAAMLKDAGFTRVTYRNLAAGVVAIHSGWKI